jgi:alkylation response protein AidB-like acyl-CoA dehydrogenase
MAQTLRSLLAQASPPARVAAVADGPQLWDAQLWSRLSSQLGVCGALVPESFGGLGLGWRELRVILHELGRSLACVPYLSSCVLAPTILLDNPHAATSAASTELLPQIATGDAIVAVALSDEMLLGPAPTAVARATSTAGGWELSGTTQFVPDAVAANHLLVPAALPDGGAGWFAAPTDVPEVAVTAMPVLDTTRPLATIELHAAPARLVAAYDSVATAVGTALDAAITGLACEQTGASQFLLELTVSYTKTRYQFGQPIGSFQAVQHRLADLALTVDNAVSAVEYAVWAAADCRRRWREASSIAGFTCSEALHVAASETVQLHGGVGFTWEHPAHRYFRRALASRSQFGAPARLRDRLLESLDI